MIVTLCGNCCIFLISYHHSDESINFLNNGNATPKLTITSGGKVGINSTSPTYALEVDGGTQNTVIAVRSSDAKAAISFLDNTSGGYGRATIGGEGDEVYITSGAGVERLRITSGGNVDIATGQLTISNDIKSSDDDFYVYSYKGGSDGQVRSGIQYDGNSQRLRFFTGTNERLRIDSSGNVRLMLSTQNSFPGFLADSNAVNFTLGSTAGAEPRIYLFGSGNGQSTAKDINILTGSGTGDIGIQASKTTITSTVNEEIFRIQTSYGNSGSNQGKALMGFDHFNVSDKPAILIGSEEEGTSSYKGSFVIKLKDAAATDDDPVERLRIASDGKVGINSTAPSNLFTIESTDNNQFAIKSDDTNADIVLSDMAAATTGHRLTDHLRTMSLLEVALEFACEVLSDGGVFLGKSFRGGADESLLALLKNRFKKVKHLKPPASRVESVETYLLAVDFNKTRNLKKSNN